jgi:hypothetical protein
MRLKHNNHQRLSGMLVIVIIFTFCSSCKSCHCPAFDDKLLLQIPKLFHSIGIIGENKTKQNGNVSNLLTPVGKYQKPTYLI